MARQQVTDSVTQMEQTLQTLNQLASTSAVLFAPALANIVQQAQTIASNINSPGFNASNQAVDSMRKQIVGIRMDIDNLYKEIDGSQSNLVNMYRSAVGDAKDEFEQATNEQQQAMSSLGYGSLQAYHAEEQLTDVLHQLNSNLMDVSHKLEQTTYKSVVPAPTNGDAPNFDNDPAPHHVPSG